MATTLSLRQLRYVCSVAQEGSIQASAKAMHISHSSILAAIDQAEHELQARMFVRTPARGVEVTPAGQRFIAAARTFLAAESDFSRSVDSLATQAPQTVRVGCFEPFGALFITEVLKRFAEKIGPSEIVLLEGDQSQLHQWLETGSIDFAVTYDIGRSFGESVSRICSVPAHALLHADDPLARKSALSLQDLVVRPMVLLDLPQTVSYLLTLFDVHGLKPTIGLRTRSYETVRSAVAAGFGFSILNMVPLGRTSQDGPHLTRRPLTDELPIPTLLVADIYGVNKPSFVTQFIEVCEQFFKEVGPKGFSVQLPTKTSSKSSLA